MASQENNNNSFSDLLYISLSDGNMKRYNFKEGSL